MTYQSRKRVNTAISAESLCLSFAMWMEMFPEPTVEHCASADINRGTLADKELYRTVGCAVVQEDGRLLAVDRSLDGVHALARLLVKHHNRVKGCSAFLSRKPCAYCAKLLVQAGVTTVSFPPVEPEYYYTKKEEERIRVLFDAGQITQNVFFPQIKMDLVATPEELIAKGISSNDIHEFSQKISARFWNEANAMRMTDCSVEQMHSDFQNLVQWFTQIYLPLEHLKFKLANGREEGDIGSKKKTSGSFDPEHNLHEGQIAKHMLGLAMMTIQRTVEPKTGVGCVIMKNNDVMAVGWNDFPSKVIEEDFHNASDQDRDKKYPFFIHAEQNALLARYTTDVTRGIIFVTKTPCHECSPLLKVAGIETVVLATSLEPIKEKYRLNYEVFHDEVKKGSFLCYEMVTVLR